LIVDGDTGFGSILNVMRTVREVEDAGAAAIRLKIEALPKKCGHLNDSGWYHPTKWPLRFPLRCEHVVICGSSRAPTRWRRGYRAAGARAALSPGAPTRSS
jgi:hypothetical protein